jgi:hypothetical protein
MSETCGRFDIGLSRQMIEAGEVSKAMVDAGETAFCEYNYDPRAPSSARELVCLVYRAMRNAIPILGRVEATDFSPL